MKKCNKHATWSNGLNKQIDFLNVSVYNIIMNQIDKQLNKIFKRDLLWPIKRRFIQAYHLLTRGFTDDDVWSLEQSVAIFLIPRLKLLRKLHGSSSGLQMGQHVAYGSDPANPEYSHNRDLWLDVIDQMIEGFSVVADDEVYENDVHKVQKVTRAFELLGKHHRGLWN